MNNYIKNKSSLIFLFLVFIIVTLFFCGCRQEKTKDAATNGYNVKDDFGYTLHFTEKPKRIIGTTGNIEEILVELVTPEHIAAISESNRNKEYSLIAEEAGKVKNTIPDRASIETIVAQHPDLVFMQIKTNQAMADTLSKMGIKVYRMETPVTLEMVRNRIRNMSITAGEQERGNAMIRELDRKIEAVKKRVAKIPQEKRKRVIGFSSLGASGSSTGVFHQLCVESGVINGGAVAGIEYAAKISDEQIIKVNPDIFIVTDEGPENEYGKATARSILKDEALKDVKAVKDKKFIFLKARYRIANSQHFGDAVTAIAKGAYPELFTE